MLKSFRGMVQGVGAWIIVGLFILAFGFVGVPALNNFGAGDGIKVGDTTISTQEVERELGRRIEAYRRESGQSLTREEAAQTGLLERSIQYLSLRGLYEQEAKTLGMVATPELVQAYLNATEDYHNPTTGKFDSEILGRILQGNRISLEEFQESIRAELLQQHLNSAIALTSNAPDTLAEYFVLRQSEERNVSTVTLTPEAATEASEEDLLSFYAANADLYQSPERRTYTLVLMDRALIEDRLTISDEDIQKLFDARKDSLGTPATRSFVQAQFADQATAQSVMAAIAEGASFEDAVAEVGGSPITLTEQTKSQIADDALADALFDATEIGTIGPIDGTFGVIVARIDTVYDGLEVTFDDVQEELRQELVDLDYATELDAIFDELQEAGDSGASLEQAANDLGLDVRTVGPVDRNFITSEGVIEDGVPLSAHIKAFEMSADDLFDVAETEGNGYAFVEVSEVVASITEPFEDVKDRVQIDFDSNSAETALDDLAARFKASVASGKTFAEAAEEFGGESITRSVNVYDPPADVPNLLLNDIFSSDLNVIVSAPSEDSSSLIVAQADSVSFGPNGQAQAAVFQVKSALSQTMSQEHFQAYLQAAQDEIGVERNDAQIAARLGLSE